MNTPKCSAEDMHAVNVQAWSDFKAQWPMEVVGLLRDTGGGFLFGVALGLAAFTAILYWVAA